jgi:hypothetical protein
MIENIWGGRIQSVSDPRKDSLIVRIEWLRNLLEKNHGLLPDV